MKFIITIDTESDIQEDSSLVVSLKNLDSLPRFQTLCEKYNFKATYLVTYRVMAENRIAKMLKGWQDEGKVEIGTHLHPWTTPPSAPSDTEFSFPHRLSDEELRAKFITIHNKITEMSGRSPTSYRAGRWGFDSRQAEILAEFGYIADCSITPKIDWSNMGGPDFRRESVFPHRLASGILEVPMTILYPNLLRQVFNKPRWLRIFPNTTFADLKSVYKTAQRKGLPYVMFMIHSNELHLATSKDTRTEEMLEHTYKQLEEMFSFFYAQGLESVTLSDYARMNAKI